MVETQIQIETMKQREEVFKKKLKLENQKIIEEISKEMRDLKVRYIDSVKEMKQEIVTLEKSNFGLLDEIHRLKKRELTLIKGIDPEEQSEALGT